MAPAHGRGGDRGSVVGEPRGAARCPVRRTVPGPSPSQHRLSRPARAGLYDVVDELPADVTILTNYPQGLWWQTRREPTLFAFTRPRPGNSHVPLTLDETIEQICARTTYLAWFAGLRNAGEGPAERRPEIVEVVDPTTEHTVPGGVLYRLALRPDANDNPRCER